VTFPADSPKVSNGLWSGVPNIVQIYPPNGPTNAIEEGGPPTAKALSPNHRLTVGEISCTALTRGGIDCQAPTGGFTFRDGMLTKRESR
jgi:hypothetical protein